MIYTDASGAPQMAAAATIRGTPWMVWVESAQSTVLGPARALLQRMLPLSVGLILLGAIVVYAVSARLTQPIQRLAAAAEGVAGGDYARRVATTKRDEVGRLGEAFNLMAARVEEAHNALEERVQQRTKELEDALTALRRTQDELVLRERLALLGQLSSSVGHELRNPLGVMTNAIYFLEMVQADAPAEVREYLGILRHQVALAEKIVGDLLDFARLKAPQRQSIAVARVIDDQCARLVGVERLTIERRIDPDLPDVEIDPVQIGQVVFNLLINAQQAMDGQGTMRIRASAHDGSVQIRVTDSGAGVPQDLQDRIFQPLFTTKARGIGLGLAVSRSLAEANGGTLTVMSPPGEGATFTITLPVPTVVAA